MEKINNPNCLWVGVSAVVRENSVLFSELKKINNYLVREMSAGMVYSEHLRPHINFYDLSVDSDNVAKIKTVLDGVLAGQKKIECRISGIKSFKFGLLYAEIENNPALEELQRKILQAVLPFKSSRPDPDYEKRIPLLSDEQKKSLQKYGNPYVADFNPHITLGFLPDKKSSMSPVLDKVSFMLNEEKFTLDTLDLVAGESSKNVRIISEWNLL